MQKIWEIKQSADSEDALDLYVYGDVEGSDWFYESTTSADHFREVLASYPDARQINVFINSYGGSVFEGVAIYNQLKRHPAHKTVYIDGFACSIASVIAMAGDTVVMPKNALMMLHNAWMCACGNSAELRKAAEDLEVINEAGKYAYLEKAGDKLTYDKLTELMDAETWLSAEACIELGLADEIREEEAELKTEILEKANLNISQRLELQKSLAASLRDLTAPEKSEAVEEKVPEVTEEATPEPEEVTVTEETKLTILERIKKNK